ncbi:MAG: helix-turn-helix transcriptional regulator [Deltaproteobacteria bacterium]|nr:helix-turn-helix transcriptional regulator [Deltaproteobacteria bacterium]
MRKVLTLQKVLKEEFKDPEFRFYFERARAVQEIGWMVRKARKKVKLTQMELAHHAKTTQEVISRMESGEDIRIPSLELLERVAHALGAKLLISFEYDVAA